MSGQLALRNLGPEAGDRLRFTWRNAREGAACWIEYRGTWRPGVIVHRGHKYASVMFTLPGWRRLYTRRAYRDLCRRVIKPRLMLVAGSGS